MFQFAWDMQPFVTHVQEENDMVFNSWILYWKPNFFKNFQYEFLKIDLRWRNTEYVLIHEQNKQISCSSLLKKIEAFKCLISA